MRSYLFSTTAGPVLAMLSGSKKSIEFCTAEKTFAIPFERKKKSGEQVTEHHPLQRAEEEEDIKQLCIVLTGTIKEGKTYQRILLGGEGAPAEKIPKYTVEFASARTNLQTKNSVLVKATFSAVGSILKAGLAGIFGSAAPTSKINTTIEKLQAMFEDPEKESVFLDPSFTDRGVVCMKKSYPQMFMTEFRISRVYQLGEHEMGHVLAHSESPALHLGTEPDMQEGGAGVERKCPFTAFASIHPELESIFWRNERDFLLKLGESLRCIEELGKHIYSYDYNIVFNRLLPVIKMHLALKDNVFGQASPPASGRSDLLISCKQERAAAMALGSYVRQVMEIIESRTFQDYVEGLEDMMASYKRVYRKEMQDVERQFGVNVSFLYVEIFHRLIKYKLYFEDAIQQHRRREEKGRAGMDADKEHGMGPLGPEERCSCLGCLLSASATRLDVVLSRTNAFKKARKIRDEGNALPSIDDEFLERVDTEKGFFLVLRNHLVFVEDRVSRFVLRRDEFAWSVPRGPAADDSDEAVSYVDLCIWSLFVSPVGDSFSAIVDFVEGVKVDWLRLNFRSEREKESFVKVMCRPLSPPTGEAYLGKICIAEKGVRIPGRACAHKISKEALAESRQRASLIRMGAMVTGRTAGKFYHYGSRKRIGKSKLEWIGKSTEKTIKFLGEDGLPRDKLALRVQLVAAALCGISNGKRLNPIVKEKEMHLKESISHSRLEKRTPEGVKSGLEEILSAHLEYLSYVQRVRSHENAKRFSDSLKTVFSEILRAGERGFTLPHSELANDILRSFDGEGGEEGFLEMHPPLTPEEFFCTICVMRMLFFFAYCGVPQDIIAAAVFPFFILDSGLLLQLLEEIERLSSGEARKTHLER